mgnify:CR=1 FL=1
MGTGQRRVKGPLSNMGIKPMGWPPAPPQIAINVPRDRSRHKNKSISPASHPTSHSLPLGLVRLQQTAPPPCAFQTCQTPPCSCSQHFAQLPWENPNATFGGGFVDATSWPRCLPSVCCCIVSRSDSMLRHRIQLPLCGGFAAKQGHQCVLHCRGQTQPGGYKQAV